MRTAILLILTIFCSSSFADETKYPDSVLKGKQLVQALKSGGYVIYFRHHLTDTGKTEKNEDLKDCKTQRNLSAAGRSEAIRVGETIRNLKIPIGKVLSSPFCRCKDTAKLIAGHFEVSDFLYFAIGLGKAEKENVTKSLKKELSILPDAGKNNVIVSHTANLKEATGIWPKKEGVAIIFKPDGNAFSYISYIDSDDWKKLAE